MAWDVQEAYRTAIRHGAAHPLVQSGKVYAEGDCFECGDRGVFIVQPDGPLCARHDGGRELIPGAIDLDYGPFLAGRVYIDGSDAIHQAEAPTAKTTACLPFATVGRMRPADGPVTCRVCLAR